MHSFGQYALGQCVQSHKKHSMIILRGKVEEQTCETNGFCIWQLDLVLRSKQDKEIKTKIAADLIMFISINFP